MHYNLWAALKVLAEIIENGLQEYPELRFGRLRLKSVEPQFFYREKLQNTYTVFVFYF
jgi:hypothetical protein